MNDTKSLVHVTLRVGDIIDKCKSWLADVTFDWRHVMVMAVERNNQLFFAAYLQDLNQNFTNNEQERCKNKVQI